MLLAVGDLFKSEEVWEEEGKGEMMASKKMARVLCEVPKGQLFHRRRDLIQAKNFIGSRRGWGTSHPSKTEKGVVQKAEQSAGQASGGGGEGAKSKRLLAEGEKKKCGDMSRGGRVRNGKERQIWEVGGRGGECSARGTEGRICETVASASNGGRSKKQRHGGVPRIQSAIAGGKKRNGRRSN